MSWEEKIFSISNQLEFEKLTLDIFHYQAENNAVYREYLSHLKKNPNQISRIEDIAFLPIEFFKSHKVVSTNKATQAVFTSSGTSGNGTSKHFVTDVSLYEKSFKKTFAHFYGNVTDYCVLALLPSYLEREGSSLIYMVKHLIKDSKHPKSGFYLHNHNDLISCVEELQKSKQKILLFGVSFALLDLAEKHRLNAENLVIMETGGMKGRRKEMTRNKLHKQLCSQLGVRQIHSEYGMTELLSQAYSKGNALFETPPWMKIMIRELYDPFGIEQNGRTGGVNIIDLANVHSCSFIETQDLGRLHHDGSFEILGRFDHADIRGCNLLVEN